MASKQDETKKWVGKFCELMDWFLSLEKVTGDNLSEASIKGLAANYLAVKLGIVDDSAATNTPSLADSGLPYDSHLWDPDYFEDSFFEQRKRWRLERMTHWKHKAEEHGVFKSTPFTPEVTSDNVWRYRECIEDIIYRVQDGWDWTMVREVSILGRQANDLAVKLGLTHPDWILAMKLRLWPHFVNAEEIRQLPLPWKCDRPPIPPTGKKEMVTASDIPCLRASIEKAQALLQKKPRAADDEPALKSLKNSVACSEVAGIIRKRSDNIARTLRSHRYLVVISAGKSYCDAEDAATVWPKWKKHWQEKKNRENS